MQETAFQGGFANAPIDAARAFRACLNALARPGRIERIRGVQPPAPLSVAAGAVLLTLCDPETPVYLTEELSVAPVIDWLRFHTGAPLCSPADAHFALGSWSMLHPLSAYMVGTPEYPDRSATLIVACDQLDGATHRLRGPGIEHHHDVTLPEAAAFQVNRALFPLGLDFYFTAGDKLMGLPRTTIVETL